jgi:hypothetical protein
MTQEGTTELYARLIKSHYFVIPFSAEHLSYEDLVKDKVLGVFLKEFANTKKEYSGLLNIACKWWLNLMASAGYTDSIVQECMKYPSFALSMHTISTVIQGVADDEKERRLAGLWLRLIVKAQIDNKEILPNVWSNIKEVTQHYYSNEEGKYKKVIYRLIPNLLVKYLSHDNSTSNSDKVNIVYSITSMLPNSSSDSDRYKIET